MMVEWLFLAVPQGCLQFVIVVFPDHTHLLFLSVTSHINCNTLPDKLGLSHDKCLSQVMMTLHILNDVANDAESTQKSKITP